MQQCIQCGYERQEKDNIIDPGTCPRCGIIYDKWRPDSSEHKPSGMNNSNTFKQPGPSNISFCNKKPSANYAIILGAVILLGRRSECTLPDYGE
jgi:predicted  nucleic acid-binding Zn-ribbon protein